MSWTNLEEFRRIYEKVPVEEFPNRVVETLPEPILSVKVSTYQHAPFIRKCLDGILMQKTSFPFEIVIGEDESSDGTREICIEYAKRHPDKIRLLLHSRANNIQVNGRPSGRYQSTYTRFMCRGEYIASCEGDDYWTNPRKLQQQVGFLENHPGYVLTCGGFETVGGGERRQTIAVKRRDRGEQWAGGFSFDLADMQHEWLTKTLTVVYRSRAYVPGEFSRYRLTRDVHLYYHLMKKGIGFYFQEVLGVYNVHSGGVHSSAAEYEKRKTKYLVYQELFENNRDDFSRRMFFKASLRLIQFRYSIDGKFSLRSELQLTARALIVVRSGAEMFGLWSALISRYLRFGLRQRLLDHVKLQLGRSRHLADRQ